MKEIEQIYNQDDVSQPESYYQNLNHISSTSFNKPPLVGYGTKRSQYSKRNLIGGGNPDPGISRTYITNKSNSTARQNGVGAGVDSVNDLSTFKPIRVVPRDLPS